MSILRSLSSSAARELTMPTTNSAATVPHLFQPGDASLPRDVKSLFDLRRAPGYYNAKEKAALLRRSKSGLPDEWFVDFSRGEIYVDGRAAGISLVGGDWSWQATGAGESLVACGKWRDVCWHREAECDYLEVELPLSGGWKLGRQVLLARKDRFLFLADSLRGRGKSAREIHHRTELALAAGVEWTGGVETRDGRLAASGRQRARLVPLALPEWRTEFCHAELAARDGHVSLVQAALGSNLYAPLWIDLDPRRQQRPLTWRRLTVAENLAVAPRNDAVAYRIQAGRQQWLIYHSLAPAANRTFLGHNTLSSFVCCRFLPSGKTKPIVAIE